VNDVSVTSMSYSIRDDHRDDRISVSRWS